ncbi:MAG TPA: SIS domain-containing protein [Chthoniobacterales bacterium]
MSKQFEKSLKKLNEALAASAGLGPVVEKAANLVAEALIAGNKLLICGNGGSGADSSHIATEFTCRFSQDRRPYPAISLTADGGLLLAIGNDYEFQDVFSRQVKAFGKPGDVLIGLSTSGKSRNVLDAIEEARRLGVKSIAFLGKGGGFTTGAADVEIIVPHAETARVQEVQKFLLHVLCEIVEEKLPKE